MAGLSPAESAGGLHFSKQKTVDFLEGSITVDVIFLIVRKHGWQGKARALSRLHKKSAQLFGVQCLPHLSHHLPKQAFEIIPTVPHPPPLLHLFAYLALHLESPESQN